MIDYLNKSLNTASKPAGATRSVPIRMLFWVGILNLFWVAPLRADEPGLPMAPSNLSASTVSSRQINFAWQDNSGNETGFRIERAGSYSGPWSQIATVRAGVRWYANAGLSGGTTYYYRVRSYNSRGSSSYSNTAVGTTMQDPSCTYSISPTSASFDSSGGSGSVSVITDATCGWTATPNDAWITLTAGSSGSGGGTVSYSATANPGASPR